MNDPYGFKKNNPYLFNKNSGAKMNNNSLKIKTNSLARDINRIKSKIQDPFTEELISLDTSRGRNLERRINYCKECPSDKILIVKKNSRKCISKNSNKIKFNKQLKKLVKFCDGYDKFILPIHDKPYLDQLYEVKFPKDIFGRSFKVKDVLKRELPAFSTEKNKKLLNYDNIGKIGFNMIMILVIIISFISNNQDSRIFIQHQIKKIFNKNFHWFASIFNILNTKWILNFMSENPLQKIFTVVALLFTSINPFKSSSGETYKNDDYEENIKTRKELQLQKRIEKVDKNLFKDDYSYVKLIENEIYNPDTKIINLTKAGINDLDYKLTGIEGNQKERKVYALVSHKNNRKIKVVIYDEGNHLSQYDKLQSIKKSISKLEGDIRDTINHYSLMDNMNYHVMNVKKYLTQIENANKNLEIIKNTNDKSRVKSLENKIIEYNKEIKKEEREIEKIKTRMNDKMMKSFSNRNNLKDNELNIIHDKINKTKKYTITLQSIREFLTTERNKYNYNIIESAVEENINDIREKYDGVLNKRIDPINTKDAQYVNLNTSTKTPNENTKKIPFTSQNENANKNPFISSIE